MGSTFSSRRLARGPRAELLSALVGSARQSATEGGRTSVVFDLDGTLLDNRPRVEVIFRELAEHWKGAHPHASEKLTAVKTEEIVYDTVENLRLLGIEDPALHESGFAFWKERFFTDAYMRHDAPLPGSVELVRNLYDAGANIVYLTGRDLPQMAVGTFASLRDEGFPIGCVGTSLVTKPDFETPDAEFKQEVATHLHRTGEVLAVFDNEPANCNLLSTAHPQAVAVFVDSHHAPNPPPLLESVHVIHTFES